MQIQYSKLTDNGIRRFSLVKFVAGGFLTRSVGQNVGAVLGGQPRLSCLPECWEGGVSCLIRLSLKGGKPTLSVDDGGRASFSQRQCTKS